MMKKTIHFAFGLWLAATTPVMAMDNNGPPPGDPPDGKGLSFEEQQANTLKHIDDRMARLSQEKTCVEAAKTTQDLKTCREKYKPPPPPHNGGGMGGPRPGGKPPM